MSTLTRFITRQGKRIEVETLSSQVLPSKARRREADLFIKMPLKWADVATKALGSRQCFVLIWLLHLAWKTNVDYLVRELPLVPIGECDRLVALPQFRGEGTHMRGLIAEEMMIETAKLSFHGLNRNLVHRASVCLQRRPISGPKYPERAQAAPYKRSHRYSMAPSTCRECSGVEKKLGHVCG
jgi:hypothetical protein